MLQTRPAFIRPQVCMQQPFLQLACASISGAYLDETGQHVVYHVYSINGQTTPKGVVYPFLLFCAYSMVCV